MNFDQNLTTQCKWNTGLVLFLYWLNAREFSSITKVQIRGTTRIYGLQQNQSFQSYQIYLHALNYIGPNRVEDMTLTVCTNNFFWKMITEPEKGCLRISLTWESGTRSSCRYELKNMHRLFCNNFFLKKIIPNPRRVAYVSHRNENQVRVVRPDKTYKNLKI